MDKNIERKKYKKSEKKCDINTHKLLRNIFKDILQQDYVLKGNADKIKEFDSITNLEEIFNDEKELARTDDKLEKCVCEEGINITKEYSVDDVRLKKPGLFPDLNTKNAKKFGLITPADILDSKAYRALEFQPKSLHICSESTCQSKLSISLPPINTSGAKIHNFVREQMPTPTKTLQKRYKPSNLIIDPINFRLSKELIIFKDYDIDHVYEANVKVQNVSAILQRVKITAQPKLKCFTISTKFDYENIRLCSGMSATFKITYKPDTFRDLNDSLEINGHKLKLQSFRDPPQLSMYLMHKADLNSNIWIDIDNTDRIEALNDTIECGSCFVGEHTQTFLICKNTGGRARFFCMTEVQWCTHYLNKLHPDLHLRMDGFTIQPYYFELAKDEFIVLTIDFYALGSNTSVENIYIVCNNITWITIDIIADGIIFDSYTLSVDISQMYHISKLRNPTELIKTVSTCSIGGTSKSQLDMRCNVSRCSPSESSTNVEAVLANYDENCEEESEKSSHFLDNFNNDESIIHYLLRQEKGDYVINDEIAEELHHTQYVLFFGETLGHKTVTREVQITNNCMIDLKCHWSFKNPFNLLLPGLYDIDTTWITITSENDNILKAYRTSTFVITINLNTIVEGAYGKELNFVIEDIPRSAIPMSELIRNLIIIDKDVGDTQKMSKVDVLYHSFYAVAFVDHLDFFVAIPDDGSMNAIFQSAEGGKKRFQFQIDYNKLDEISGEWQTDCENIKITPSQFVSRKGIPQMFELEVTHIKSYGLIGVTKLILESVYEYTVPINISVQKPRLIFNYTTLKLGLLYKGNTYKKCFKILNLDSAIIDWEIHEQYRQECDTKELNKIKIEAVNLDCGDVDVIYTITAGAEMKWTSTLIIYIIIKGVKTMTSKMLITYDIVEYPVLLHTDQSDCPILCPKNVLYVNNPQSFILCFHNLTQYNVVIDNDELYGPNVQDFMVEVTPKRHAIPANSIERVNLTITAQVAGIFNNISVPFIYCNNSPYLSGEFHSPTSLILNIILAVDDICVRVKLPQSNNESKEILWPPPNSLILSQTDISDIEQIGPSEFSDSHIEQLYPPEEVVIPKDLIEYLKTIQTAPEYNPPTPQEESLRSNFTSDSIYSDITTCHFTELFENLSKYTIDICNVPLRECITCTIELENITPVPGTFKINVTNFPCKVVQKKKIDLVLEKLNYKKNDDWDKRIGEYGIGIYAEIRDKNWKIEPLEKKEIIIYIYANTWGKYKEDLIIDFNNILPLRISMIIDIVGMPLEFPACADRSHNTFILRFGHLPFKSEYTTRDLYIKNVSNVPVNVIWHIFMRKSKGERGDEPLTVLFDTFHPDPNDLTNNDMASQGNLLIAHGKVVGKSDARIFKLDKKETLIQPNNTCVIKLRFNPGLFVTAFEIKEIEAYLIGYVELPQKYRHDPLLFYRAIGSQLLPVKAKLTATLELPILKLDMSENDLHFYISVDSVINQGFVKQIKTLTFKNHNFCDANIKFSVGEPFEIENCTSSNVEVNDGVYDTKISPNEAAVIRLKYEVNKQEALSIANCLFNDNDEDMIHYARLDTIKNIYNIRKTLNMEQKGLIRQHIPITLSIYFPIMEVTKSISFGAIWIESTASSVFTLRNFSVCAIMFNIVPTDNFLVNPCKGVLLPGTTEKPMIRDIQVIFKPLKKDIFNETITIQTFIPSLKFKVTVTGEGKINSKYYFPDTC